MRVLVVDDVPANRRLFRALLEDELTVVIDACDGLEALAMLEVEAVDVVISDILMPRMDGYRLCRAIRQHPRLRGLPFIFCTSTYTSSSDEKFAKQVGCDLFLKKPIGGRELRAALEQVFPPGATSRQAGEPQGVEDDAEEGLLREHIHRVSEKLQQKSGALVESQARIGSLTETIDGVFWEANLEDLAFVFVSDYAERLLGFPREHWLEVPDFLQRHLYPDDRSRVLQEMREKALEGFGFQLEFRMIDAWTKIIWLRNLVSRREPEGASTRIRGVMFDVSERKVLEAQLVQAQKMEAVGRLAGGVAHEFNNLLGVMQMQVELLLEDASLTPRAAARTRSIEERIQNAIKLTRQLLTLSRKQTLEISAVDLNEIVANHGRLLQRLLGKAIEVSLDLAPERLIIEGDPGMIEQVLLNLALNARDAMPGGGRLAIGTEVSGIAGAGSGRQAILTVSDSGSGIDPKILEHIFEPFFTTKDPEKGTGLGLSTVYGIVEKHRGRIEVESRKGEGTCFRICLPASGQGT